MIEREIEVFRVGGAASRHIKPEHLAEVATFDCSANPVPLCFGHPKDDTPAAGTISKFRADGNSLFATVASMTDAAIEGVKSGAWLNRSMAFFDPTHEANPEPGKWRPRHVGLLGGSAPGIPGMGTLKKALAFAADGETLEILGDPADAMIYAAAPEEGTPVHVVFTAKEAPTMASTPTTLTPEQRDAEFTARENAVADRERKAAERVRNAFNASNNSAIDALVRETKVLPAEAENLKTAFAALDPEGEELTFGAGDKTSKATAVGAILAFMAGLPKRVPIDGQRSPSTQFDADPATPPSTFAAASASAGAITAKAEELMKTRPDLTFEAAVAEVSGGGNLPA